MKVLYSALFREDGHPFNVLAEKTRTVTLPEQLTETDSALVVWGGADIHPSYYGHPQHPTTHAGGMRDKLEWSLMNEAVDRGIPIIGVCRGAQMLCALAGGWLIQDCQDHAGRGHFIRTYDESFLHANSLHHQMMAGLENVEHELVAWAEGQRGAPYGYKDGQVYENKDFKEPEFVFFPKVRGYAIQWHPEMMPSSAPATKYALDYITKKEQEIKDGYSSTVLHCTC